MLDTAAVLVRAGYDVTLTSVRGGTIPFDPASMDPANADYKIVQRFFEDGAPCGNINLTSLTASQCTPCVERVFCGQTADTSGATFGQQLLSIRQCPCCMAWRSLLEDLSDHGASSRAEEVVTDIHNTASIAYQLATDYDILYIVGGAQSARDDFPGSKRSTF